MASHYRLQMPDGKGIEWYIVERPESVLVLPVDLNSHHVYVAHKVHLLVAYDLEWNPLEMEDGEEIRVLTFTMDEVLAATREDYRCDPEAALAQWLYAGTDGKF